ncbi:hypothetical protein GMMP15_940022 [Candidatus Magnetomoraceae bacterium gMMP-15]
MLLGIVTGIYFILEQTQSIDIQNKNKKYREELSRFWKENNLLAVNDILNEIETISILKDTYYFYKGNLLTEWPQTDTKGPLHYYKKISFDSEYYVRSRMNIVFQLPNKLPKSYSIESNIHFVIKDMEKYDFKEPRYYVIKLLNLLIKDKWNDYNEVWKLYKQIKGQLENIYNFDRNMFIVNPHATVSKSVSLTMDDLNRAIQFDSLSFIVHVFLYRAAHLSCLHNEKIEHYNKAKGLLARGDKMHLFVGGNEPLISTGSYESGPVKSLIEKGLKNMGFSKFFNVLEVMIDDFDEKKPICIK